MSAFIIFGVICAVIVVIGKLVLKVVQDESVPPYVAALNADEGLIDTTGKNHPATDTPVLSPSGGPLFNGQDLATGHVWGILNP